jgi:uncharacterized membrane protein YidH (DUF202 family)
MPSPERPGLARERTGLAWERSAFAYVAAGAVMLGVSAHRNAPGLLVLSAALLLVALSVLRHGRRAYDRGQVAPQSRAIGLLSLATAATALAAAIIVLAH